MVSAVGASSVLTSSGFSQAGGLRSLALQKMQEAMLDQISKETAVNTDKFQAKFDEYQAKVVEQSKVKGKVGLAINNLKYNLTAVEDIKSTLFDMKVLVETAATTTDLDYIRGKFDKALAEVNKAADRGAKVTNIIGNNGQTQWADLEYEFFIDEYGTTDTVTGQYLGADFYIDDSAGKRWVPEWASVSLERFNDFPSDDKADSDYYSMLGTVTVNSFDGTNVDFTVYSGLANEANYTGTVAQGGLDVLPSMFYEDFSTSAGLTDAEDAITLARDQVLAYESVLKADIAQAEARAAKIQDVIDDYSNKSVEAAREALYAQAEGQVELQTRYQAMVLQLQSIQQSTGQYDKMFSRFLSNSNKLSGFMIDQTA